MLKKSMGVESMKLSKKINGGLYGAIIIILSNLIIQEDWGITLFVAMAFAIGGIVLPRLITFMSDDTQR